MNWLKKFWILLKKKFDYKDRITEIPLEPLIMPILSDPGKYIFYCPGCELNHTINTSPSKLIRYHNLTGPAHCPTIRASVLYVDESIRCHSFITNGTIEFLEDCSHDLAGMTVKLKPI